MMRCKGTGARVACLICAQIKEISVKKLMKMYKDRIWIL